jgi:HSP20 family protein
MTLAPFTSRQGRGGQSAAAPATRWDPYREMEEINSRFGQLVRMFFGDTSGAGAERWSPLAPPVDAEETDNAYVVDVNLPNVNPDDIMIEMRGEELRVSGKHEKREHAGVVRRQNRPMGDFEYVVDLPSDIDPNRVEATYDRGVLTISIGKTQATPPRRIEVRKSQGEQQSGSGGGQQQAQQSPGQSMTQSQSGQNMAQAG